MVGVTSPVSEILLLPKTVKFPFQSMGYIVHGHQKINCLKSAQKFMHVRVDEVCIHTNFGGCDFSSFRDIATSKNGQISLSEHGL